MDPIKGGVKGGGRLFRAQRENVHRLRFDRLSVRKTAFEAWTDIRNRFRKGYS